MNFQASLERVHALLSAMATGSAVIDNFKVTPKDLLCAVEYLDGAKDIITLRDEFAMAALKGMLTDPSAPPMPSDAQAWAKAAYRHADAMLEVRKL